MAAPQLETLRQRVQACATDQDVTDYQRDGAVCIRNLFTPEEVALLRDGIEANLAHPSPRGIVKTFATGKTSLSTSASSSTRPWPHWRSA
jgi:hypothetical protein